MALNVGFQTIQAFGWLIQSTVKNQQMALRWILRQVLKCRLVTSDLLVTKKKDFDVIISKISDTNTSFSTINVINAM